MTEAFRGAIFDVDGVLVDSPHEAAWRATLEQLMEHEWADVRDQTSWTPEAFTADVYQRVLSGRPRMEGALAALEHFSVPEPATRVAAYAERKQAQVVTLIEEGRFSAYPDALRFVLAVKNAGLAVAAASSSRNAGLFLRQIDLHAFALAEGLDYDWLEPGLTLLSIFDVDTSGRKFEHGKPHPEMFVTTAKELGIDPQHCFVIEDAVAGVQAAKAGSFAACGLARHDDDALLAAADADIVVNSLDDVELDALGEGRLAQRTPGP